MGYYIGYRDDNAPFTAFILVISIIGGICFCIQRLVEIITPPLVAAGKWMISFHFSNIFECMFHFYLWLVHVPVAVVIIVGIGLIAASVGYGIYGGYKLATLINFGEGWLFWILKFFIGLFLCALGGGIGVGLSFYIIGGGAIFLLTSYWLGITFIKDKVLRLTWMGDVSFAILIYTIIPGCLLTGFLLTR